jgi:hypothetical protein
MTSPSSGWCREDGFCRCRSCKPPLGDAVPARALARWAKPSFTVLAAVAATIAIAGMR